VDDVYQKHVVDTSLFPATEIFLSENVGADTLPREEFISHGQKMLQKKSNATDLLLYNSHYTYHMNAKKNFKIFLPKGLIAVKEKSGNDYKKYKKHSIGVK
jgi:hypothetical protein